jgi:1-deoxyxylulose-5-phosphate synthase
MNYVVLGNTGEEVSELCLGTMMFGGRTSESEADHILGTAMDGGVNFVDTAAMYQDGGTETLLGRLLSGRRDHVFLVTKVHQGTDGASVRRSIDESLRRLQLDYVDLYLIHWPKIGMRPTEMMEALNDVVQQGKTRYVGCSNFPAWLVAHCNQIAADYGWAPLVVNQVPYNLVERGIEVEVLPQAMAEGTGIVTYRPLLIGILAGKYLPHEPLPEDARAHTDPRVADWLQRFGPSLERMRLFGLANGLTMPQLAIAWVRHSPAVTAPIVGFSRLEQVGPALEAFNFELDAAQYAELTAMFDTAVKEEAGGEFPNLRRELHLLRRREQG